MKIDTNVFVTSATVILLFVAFGAFYEPTWGAMKAVQTGIVTYFGWFYTLVMAFLLGFVLWLLFSDYGDITLGPEEESPKYPYVSWFSMLFSAGIGIGLLFFGVSEPLAHYQSPPPGSDLAPGGETVAAARHAIALLFFHWGLHGWALYVTVGLSLAFFGHRRDLPLTFRSTLYPLLGDDIHGTFGDAMEVLAVFGTLFGVATSLGLGVRHVNAGLEHLGWLEQSTFHQLMLIAVITLAATISVVSGLDRGIRRLSEVNFGLGILLMIFVFATGPTMYVVRAIVEQFGYYLQHLVELTFTTGAFAETAFQGDRNEAMAWQQSWTLFYWGWWIAWCPFVGMFIAQISRGRTVREFILGVLLVPSLFIFLWMGIFGNTGIYLQHAGEAALLEQPFFMRFYGLLDALPWSGLTITVATASGIIYFVTSSDSASLIIDLLTSKATVDPPVWQRVFWAVIEGAVAGTLLWVGGQEALKALRAASLTAALPFSIALLFIAYCLVVGLKREKEQQGR
jgi:choline/glycine/proline betaine transport protein